MDTKSSIIESNTIENHFKIEVKDDNNKEQCTDLLIEPIIAGNINKPVKSSPTIATHFLGVIYTLVSTLIFVSSTFITKELSIDMLYALIPMALLHSIMMIIHMKLIKRYSLYRQSTKQEIFFLFINSFSFSTGAFALYFAYRYLTLPDLTTIRFTQVIWTAIITAVLYCEKPSLPMIIAILLTTIGVIFVAQPTFLFSKISNINETNISNDPYQHLIGLSIALYASIALSLMVISNKHLLSKYKTKHSLIMLLTAFATFCVLVVNVFYKYNFFRDHMQSFKNDFFNMRYLFASSICLLQIPALVLVQKAIKCEHPSIFTILQSSAILFSLILQNIFSSVKSNVLSLFGSALVLTSILLITGFKFMNEKRAKKKALEQNSTE
ncbi:unnamed protein product [Rotaria sordida]|uniref:EamA domain-containing protein n=1 Tax=Rotaria sordida TaxID=392033 RepID=A0A819PX19_9BILA|nr:unnamed protein product [Rotaria sordida]